MGSSLSEEQLNLIADAVGPQGKVALMFDEDDAGRHCRDDAIDRLINRRYVRVMALGTAGTQPDALSDDVIHALLG
jgi:DNA primase